MSRRRVMISCGEASGDLYAAALVRELRALDPDLEVVGFGGPRLAAAGADLVGSYEGVSVTGLVEAASVLRRSWQMLAKLREVARTRPPDVFVAIDFPDFNFRLLPPLHALGVPIVYYISPQLWAWRPGRLETLRKYVRRMVVIFPFELDVYRQAGMPVDFVGHPLLDLAHADRRREEWLPGIGLDPDAPVVALLPGSRPSEVRHMLPTLVEAAAEIAARVPHTQFLVARAPALSTGLFASVAHLRDRGIAAAIHEGADDVLAAADVVVTASGTATVQTALHGKPMVVVYRLSPLTYALGRAFVRVAHFSMVNLVAGRAIVPELIQKRFTPEAVASETVSLLTDRARADTMRADLAAMRARLGGPGASRRAAAAIMSVLS